MRAPRLIIDFWKGNRRKEKEMKRIVRAGVGPDSNRVRPRQHPTGNPFDARGRCKRSSAGGETERKKGRNIQGCRAIVELTIHHATG